MACSFCLKNKTLIRAHIIPEWCFREMYPDPKNRKGSLVRVDKIHQFTKRVPIGIYDENILCKDCDSKLGTFDDYAKQIFFDEKIIIDSCNEKIWWIDNVDVIKIELFLISVLWRASVSNIEDFQDVHLGRYQAVFRDALLQHKTVDEVEVIIGKFSSQHKSLLEFVTKSIQLPFRHRLPGLEGKNFYTLYLPKGFKILIKVDKKLLSSTERDLTISSQSNKILVIDWVNYEESYECSDFLQVADKIPIYNN